MNRVGKQNRGHPLRPFLAATGVAVLAASWTALLRGVGFSPVVGLPRGLRVVGGVGTAGAVGLALWSLRTLGVRRAIGAVDRLVTSGPYRWIRHPLYTAVCMGLFSLGLVGGWVPLFLTGLCWCLVVAVQARREEAGLLARFGEEYRAYQRRTGRFLPPLG